MTNAKVVPVGSEEGIDEARRRIADAKRSRAEELDIGGLGLVTVPEELSELGQLKVLYLGLPKEAADKPYRARTEENTKSCNAIRELPPALFGSLPELSKLHLEHNRLTGLPKAVEQLSQLTSLDLRENALGAEGVRALSSLVSLTSLDLGENAVGAEGARALSGLVNLTSLDLIGNGLGVEGVRALTGLINLTSLALGWNGLGDEGAHALSNLVNLNSLNLGGNRLGAEGARVLAGLVNLTNLNVRANHIGAEGARAISGLVNLANLNLGGNRLGAEGARALSHLVSLNNLNLGENGLGPDGAHALSGIVNLTTLGLGENDLGDDGARAISGLVNLTSIDLRSNSLGPEGVRALSGLVNLTSLGLGWNGLGVDSARALSGLVNLTALGLWHSDVKDLSPLTHLVNLKYLDCSGCQLDAPVPELWAMPSLEIVLLHEATLPGVPAEVLSPNPHTSCLESLRAHFADVANGDAQVTDVKVMLLGNGRVGKTQICRRLRGQAYDETVPSTHGVQVWSTRLPLTAGDTATLDIWDFGGQDIYHGTHALFLASRAVFLLAWTPELEAMHEHEHGGFTFRNQPLGYWLAYVRKFGGADAPVLVVQAQCDLPEQVDLLPPTAEEALSEFPFKMVRHYSAREDRDRAKLDDALAEAVRWLRRGQGVARIGKGRAKVKTRLEKLYTGGKRLVTHAEFLALCQEVGTISSPPLLLDYLHNTGAVFYREGLFGDDIILDQAWALDAVYAVFDRQSKAFRNIESCRGRFRRSNLAEWVWKKHRVEEQELFLSFMQQCGICFTIRKGDGDIEAEYVAPDLLPGRDDPEIAEALRERWGDHFDADRTLRYELLPPGLMRSLIAKIGEVAGLAAVYWRDGFYFYDGATGSGTLVEQRRAGDWGGEICVQTKGGRAQALLDRVLAFIDQRNDGCGARASGRSVAVRDMGAGSHAAADLKPTHEPLPGPGYYVSYAWGDDSEEGRRREDIVDKLCEAATARGIAITRDRKVMRYGDRISKFMDRIGRGDRVFIVLSDKYLKSPYCMHELFDVWRNCREDADEFINRTRVYVLPCARIETVENRIQYVHHWRREFEKRKALMNKHAPDAFSRADYDAFHWMETFVSNTSDMLTLINDVLTPKTFEDFERYGFDDPPKGT